MNVVCFDWSSCHMMEEKNLLGRKTYVKFMFWNDHYVIWWGRIYNILTDHYVIIIWWRRIYIQYFLNDHYVIWWGRIYNILTDHYVIIIWWRRIYIQYFFNDHYVIWWGRIYIYFNWSLCNNNMMEKNIYTIFFKWSLCNMMGKNI